MRDLHRHPTPYCPPSYLEPRNQDIGCETDPRLPHVELLLRIRDLELRETRLEERVTLLEQFQLNGATEIMGALFGTNAGPKFARIDPDDDSDQPRILLDRDDMSAETDVEASKPDDRYLLRFVQRDVIITFLGAPDRPTEDDVEDGDVRCFETRPSHARGASESPFIVQYPPTGPMANMICASVEYIKGGVHFLSMNLTLVRQTGRRA